MHWTQLISDAAIKQVLYWFFCLSVSINIHGLNVSKYIFGAGKSRNQMETPKRYIFIQTTYLLFYKFWTIYWILTWLVLVTTLLSSVTKVPPSKVGFVEAGSRWVEVVKSRTSGSTDLSEGKNVVSDAWTGLLSVKNEETCLWSDKKVSVDPPRKKLSLFNNKSVKDGSSPPVSAEMWSAPLPAWINSCCCCFPLKIVVVESGNICWCCLAVVVSILNNNFTTYKFFQNKTNTIAISKDYYLLVHSVFSRNNQIMVSLMSQWH